MCGGRGIGRGGPPRTILNTNEIWREIICVKCSSFKKCLKFDNETYFCFYCIKSIIEYYQNDEETEVNE